MGRGIIRDNMRKKKIYVFIVIAIIIATSIYLARGFFMPKTSNQWYAVHLTNGQVYFGRITSITSDTIAISDTYYLEATPNPMSTSNSFIIQQESKPTYKLTRRGDDTMLSSDHKLFINRSTVLFWEKLQDTSDVVRLIVKGNS